MRLLGGISLIGRAVRRARDCGRVDRVVVSTDSPEIAEEARRHGAEVPFLRPPRLSSDETPMLDVLLHAYRFLGETGRAPSAIALLQPTSPLVRPETVAAGIDRFRASGARLLKAVARVREHPAWMLARRGDRLVPFLETPPVRRQELPELFIPCGALYVYRADYLEAPRVEEPVAWIEVDWPETIDIDEPRDLELAGWALEREGPGRKA